MPADRRIFTANKPIKTERTHEENQERAYIAASRRSDRSLEARIESARRASEIHKKRTGRALRVTEQDVLNEEMYEEEDDDLPTQYKRLNAHLQTTSIMFNKKLHDYIATQQGVRNMFMAHYQNPSYQPFSGQGGMSANSYPHVNWVNPAMMGAPQSSFNPSTPAMAHPPQSFSTFSFQQQQQQQQQARPAPYHIPQRSPSHQRSASIPTPHPMPNFESPTPANSAALIPGGDASRRMSLPPHVLEQSTKGIIEGQSRPPLSRSSTSQSIQQQHVSSPHALTNSSNTPSDQGTPKLQSECSTPGPQTFNPMNYAMSSQVLNMTPLSMSLPPESQQLVGSVLDPNDPRTAIFMAGSDNLPQPFAPTYTYNPNVSPKASRTVDTGSATNLKAKNTSVNPQAPTQGESVKLETSLEDDLSSVPMSATTDLYSPGSLFPPGTYDGQGFFDFQSTGYGQTLDDPLNNDQPVDHFVNWDSV